MMVCDRCKKKITEDGKSVINKKVFIYLSKASRMPYNVDLCSDCKDKLQILIDITTSYFMINEENKFDILDGVKYWK